MGNLGSNAGKSGSFLDTVDTLNGVDVATVLSRRWLGEQEMMVTVQGGHR
jgi:hypothetical protein